MNKIFVLSACALATSALLSEAVAQEAALDSVVVTAKRSARISTGATGLSLDVKETPQSISILDTETMTNFGTTGSNEALRLATGINVEQYETNRAVFNSRGFEIQSTQIDGLGVINSWGTVVGQQDTYLFDRIELIRGANGLLTGVGNASGTINYVRKRPLNTDTGEVVVSVGSHNTVRTALDYNKVFTEDGSWAGRIVAVYEDKDSYLRDLNDKNGTVYAVVDGQIGRDGMLTFGYTHQDMKQKSPMWGSLTLNYLDGTMADFSRSSSTSQDWTYWNTRSNTAFVEYRHNLAADWELKTTYSHTTADEKTQLFYAFAAGGLNADNTGLYGWPYKSATTTTNQLLDVNVAGRFGAFGRRHELIAGLSYSQQKTDTDAQTDPTFDSLNPPPLVAFPYANNIYPEPDWVPAESTQGKQKLTRFYAATRLSLTDGLKGIVGLNAVKLVRSGNSRYGATSSLTSYPDTDKLSPYAGLTYDFTPELMGYVSYSDIFQNQDQRDINGRYLDPTKGVNYEAGVKAEWLNKKLLTTASVFTAEQNGLATYAGMNSSSQSYYEGKDVKSTGIELEASGRISTNSRLALGLTHLKLSGPDGSDTFEWVPRTTANVTFDTRLPAVPKLKLGVTGRWQSKTYKEGGAHQDAYFLAHGFAAYDLSDRATVRLNVNNLFDKKYINGLSYGAIYGAPRNAMVSLSYAL
jgi:outer-membrane receptor for ferric coprogen and ferric-rhodotorulic acid